MLLTRVQLLTWAEEMEGCKTHIWGLWGVPAVADSRGNLPVWGRSCAPSGQWPCVVGPLAEHICIGSQECVDNDLCLLIAWRFGTAVVSFPLALVLLVVAKWPAFLLWDYKSKSWLVLPLVLVPFFGGS